MIVRCFSHQNFKKDGCGHFLLFWFMILILNLLSLFSFELSYNVWFKPTLYIWMDGWVDLFSINPSYFLSSASFRLISFFFFLLCIVLFVYILCEIVYDLYVTKHSIYECEPKLLWFFFFFMPIKFEFNLIKMYAYMSCYLPQPT